MNRAELTILIKENPTIKILRGPNAPLILAFLMEMFKKNQRITIPADELIISLGAYLEMEEYPLEGDNPDYLEKAGQMISLWCNEENWYMRKYVNDKGISVHELTGYTEKVFRWLDDLKPRETIGTESRFYDILRRLDELVSKSMENPEEKIKELKEKRKAIDREIREIESSGIVKSFSTWQIKERFEEISRNSRDLLADFKEVEQNFKGIVDSIYKEEVQNSHSRGDILGFALDAHQELKDSPQGKTFHSFWQFLITDSGKDSINNLVRRVYEMLEEKSLSREDEFLKNLKRYLHRAGKRIIDSNHRLGKKINRLLSENNILQRRRIRELMTEIKQLVFDVKETPPGDDFFTLLSGEPEIFMPLERPLQFPGEKQEYDEITAGEEIFDYKKMSTLFNHFYIDKKKLESNIRRLLKEKPVVHINEVLKRFPPEKGLSEIISYYEIAASSLKNRIIEDASVIINYEFNKKHKRIKAPEVIFSR
ncbi:MAG: DUF3375 domain-containing protein [Spirochaetales bacterium]|nr:DUF3375 domain-containing protein [Spirochaetales bacterium]